MTHFGKIFKKFRQSRGIKLKDVAKLVYQSLNYLDLNVEKLI